MFDFPKICSPWRSVCTLDELPLTAYSLANPEYFKVPDGLLGEISVRAGGGELSSWVQHGIKPLDDFWSLF